MIKKIGLIKQIFEFICVLIFACSGLVEYGHGNTLEAQGWWMISLLCSIHMSTFGLRRK